MTQTLYVQADPFLMGSEAILPIEFDLTPVLLEGETPSAPVWTLIDKNTDAAYPDGLIGAPSVTATSAIQTVGNLEPGHRYFLTCSVTVDIEKVWEFALKIRCPF